MTSPSPWILVDYDRTGLMQIQANDAHPWRGELDDELALALARKAARGGDQQAIDDLCLHDRDALAIFALHRPRNLYWSQELADSPYGHCLIEAADPVVEKDERWLLEVKFPPQTPESLINHRLAGILQLVRDTPR